MPIAPVVYCTIVGSLEAITAGELRFKSRPEWEWFVWDTTRALIDNGTRRIDTERKCLVLNLTHNKTIAWHKRSRVGTGPMRTWIIQQPDRPKRELSRSIYILASAQVLFSMLLSYHGGILLCDPGLN